MVASGFHESICVTFYVLYVAAAHAHVVRIDTKTTALVSFTTVCCATGVSGHSSEELRHCNRRLENAWPPHVAQHAYRT